MLRVSCLDCGAIMGAADAIRHRCSNLGKPLPGASWHPPLRVGPNDELSIDEGHARRHGPVTRDELLTAIENARKRFGGNGTELSDAIADALQALIAGLR